MATKIEAHLRSFLSNSAQSFKLLYTSPQNQFILPITNQILILDSSFNPPHKGHYSLITKSILHKFTSRESSQNAVASLNTKTVLLLLSVKNADKAVQPAPFKDRLAMMYELADVIHDNLGVACSVGITNQSLFMDKVTVIDDYIQRELLTHKIELTFLLGYDTLLRLFDPKYYTPKSVSEALSGLFGSCGFFVLTRGDKFHSSKSQLDYFEKIKSGQNELIPAKWAERIAVVEGDDDSLDVSSSEIRAAVGDGSSADKWEPKTWPTIANYIKTKGLYKE